MKSTNVMSPLRSFSLLACALMSGALAMAACDTETATTIVLDNAYPAVPDNGDPAAQTVVYRGWWVTTYFPDPVAGGASSEVERSVPNGDFAYAVIAPGWDPASATPPTKVIALKSKTTLAIDRGDLLHIAVSDQTFNGNCAANQPLSQDDADFITQRIFPGVFANVTYDAKTCSTTPVSDAGADASDAADGD